MASIISSDECGTSWEDMLSSIKDALQTSEINKAEVIRILSSYRSEESDWERYAFFDDTHYTRNLVDSSDGIYYLMVLAWNKEQRSCIHDHPNSCCFVKVLAGTIQEIRYNIPQKGEELSVLGDYTRNRDEVCYIDNSIGLHEMRNDSKDQVVTLHLYVPPYDMCKSYDPVTLATSRCNMSFNSLYGEIKKRK